MADTPEPSSSSGDTFGFLTKKVGPLPVWAWGVIAVGIYYWYTHYGPGASSAKTPSTGNGTGDAVTETVNTVTGPTSDTGSSSDTVNPPPVVTPPPVDNPPPVDTPPPVYTPPPDSDSGGGDWSPPPARVVKPANHNPPRQSEPARSVTVAKWPGRSRGGRAQWNTTLSGIASHEHIPLGYLEKDNPQIRNPNLVYPGEKIRIPDAHQEHVYHEQDIRGRRKRGRSR